MSDMGSFRVEVELENPARRGERRQLNGVLVDTGAELSWIPSAMLESLGIQRERLVSFRPATGPVVERWTGVAIVHVAGVMAGDQVVFAEPGDLTLLGSRSLEGLNLMIDPVKKRLVDAGAMPAALAGGS
jgi:predicted aspartyl protease